MQVSKIICFVLLALPCFAQNWVRGKVAYMLAEEDGQHAIVGWNVAICAGVIVHQPFRFTTDLLSFLPDSQMTSITEDDGSRRSITIHMHGTATDKLCSHDANATFRDHWFKGQEGMGCGDIEIDFTN